MHGLPFYQGQNPFAYALFRELELFAGRRTDLLLTQNREEQRLLRALLPGMKAAFYTRGTGWTFPLPGAFAKRRSAARKALGLLPTRRCRPFSAAQSRSNALWIFCALLSRPTGKTLL